MEKIFNLLRERYKVSEYKNEPFQVLIGTILSQRTKDENTAIAWKSLFSHYKTPKDIAKAPEKKLRELIKVVGFYKVKAERIKEVARILVERYKGEVPRDISELLKLPGVGRKTANCVLAYGFGIPALPVDTHVHRISNRIGLVSTKDPVKTEIELKKVVPKRYWIYLNELLVKFGKDICKPINPKCNLCLIRELCLTGRINKLPQAFIP
ncbi:MAG: endonuclease III [bacterium]|nr:endonuclease III [bacterium]